MGNLNWERNKTNQKIQNEQRNEFSRKAHRRSIMRDDPRAWIMPFGSYKGKTLEKIHQTDPTYIVWMRDNLDRIAQKKAQEFLQDENDRILKRGRYAKKGVMK